MYRCDVCDKGVLSGRNVSHSKRRTNKKSFPNLHQVRVLVGGGVRRLRLCTKCLRVTKIA
jgi:large subunit ribosomal protein L28